VDAEEQLCWKTNLIRWSQELGFVSIGFTSAQPIDGLAQLLQKRIDQGLSTPFEIKDIEQRINPKAVWQSCQTVVALAYPLPYSSSPQLGEGVLARSAVGEDYHYFMEQKVNSLVEIMASKKWPGTTRKQVDIGPLVERAFAIRAGVGWIGRNQQLIIPGYGSFVVLALLLLDQEIEPDHPLRQDHCGICQSCVQACPAQILGKEPFAAKHCVSYLTQSKAVLTSEEGESLGLRLFGCDTCQEVCPHNQKRIEEEQASSSSYSLRRGVDLMETLNLSKGEFCGRFKATAAGWRGKGVLQRNAFLALRNLQDGRGKHWLAERENGQSVPPILTPYINKY